MIKGAFLMPHPPIIIPNVGKGQEKLCQSVIDGMYAVGEQIKNLKPKTIIVITPHGPVFSDGIAIGYDAELKGNLVHFGHREIELAKMNNLRMVDKIIYESGKIDVPCLKLNKENADYFKIEKTLDHGVIVPLSFVDERYNDYQLVHITYGLFSSQKLYEFGVMLQHVVQALDEEVVIIASGDMSHCLKEEGPYPYHPLGKVFDQKMMTLLSDKKILDVMFFDEKLQKAAGECGKKSIDILLGTLDGYDYEAKKYAYDGPFGVGYLVMGFETLIKSESRLFLSKMKEMVKEEYSGRIKKEHHFIRLARRAIEHYLGLREQVMDDSLTPEMLEHQAGIFVSIKKHGALRGCIGTIGPTQENIAMEIVANAVKAAFEDPRFPELEKEELPEISISVDVLLPPERIKDKNMLDVKKYGVIVTSGYKRGLLLPNLEGITTVDEQLRIACQKGGIAFDDDYELERFEVVRYE